MIQDKHRLNVFGLPLINDLNDLSQITHLSKQLLYRLSKYPKKNYKVYKVAKKGGKKRSISQPSKELKAVQSWVLRNILDKLESHPSCNGFEKNKSILDNALPHVGSNIVMCLDLDNFFPNVRSSHVWMLFRTLGYNAFVCTILTSL